MVSSWRSIEKNIRPQLKDTVVVESLEKWNEENADLEDTTGEQELTHAPEDGSGAQNDTQIDDESASQDEAMQTLNKHEYRYVPKEKRALEFVDEYTMRDARWMCKYLKNS